MDWLKYVNQGAVRSLPLSDRMIKSLSFLPAMGVQMEVFSGGQPEKGSGKPRVGSVRHDHGDAADVFFYKDGRKLDWANEADRPIFEQIVSQASANGLTGFGAGDGYMQRGSMHLGYGNKAVWGANGKGVNAPDWLRRAAGGSPAGQTYLPQIAGQKGTDFVAGQQGADTMQQEQPTGLMGNILGPKGRGGINPEKIAKLQMMLEGMTMRPNQGVMQVAQHTLKTAQQGKARNKTVEWLRQNGREDLAAAVANGVVPAASAVNDTLKNQAKPASIQALEAQAIQAGLEPGTDEYKNFMLNGGSDPATFRALDLQARSAGFEPGTPEYQEFMATRGKGLQSYAATTGTNTANAETAYDGERAKSAGAAAGKQNVVNQSETNEMARNMPGLEVVVQELRDLSKIATYTKAGVLADEARKQVGAEPTEGAIARAKYIALVDNQVLPLLRQTFGAAFTAKEGESLRATLGDPDKSPEEKNVVLDAFIAQKRRDLEARGVKAEPPKGGAGDEPIDVQTLSDDDLKYLDVN